MTLSLSLSTVAIVIGRNPLSATRWKAFQASTDQLVRPFFHTLYARAKGPGQYSDVYEDSVAWIGTVPSHQIIPLKAHLADLASHYQQEAVGFLIQPDTATLLPASAAGAS